MEMNQEQEQQQFVICVRNEGADDLQVRRVYEVLPDEKGAQEGYIRIIDESGEDYLDPASYFVAIELPQAAREALKAA